MKPKQKVRKCLAPPQNVTVAYLAYNARDEAIFKSALDAVNARESPGIFTPSLWSALPHACACLCSLSPLERGMGMLVI